MHAMLIAAPTMKHPYCGEWCISFHVIQKKLIPLTEQKPLIANGYGGGYMSSGGYISSWGGEQRISSKSEIFTGEFLKNWKCNQCSTGACTNNSAGYSNRTIYGGSKRCTLSYGHCEYSLISGYNVNLKNVVKSFYYIQCFKILRLFS